MGIRVFIVGYVRNVKRHFSAKQGVLVTHSRRGWVASLSREIIDRPDCPFYPVVLQLSWPFSFLHASHVWHFGESTVASHSQDLVARILLNAHTPEFPSQNPQVSFPSSSSLSPLVISPYSFFSFYIDFTFGFINIVRWVLWNLYKNSKLQGKFATCIIDSV